MEIVYLNGRLVPRSRARVSPFDHGFLYGFGIFETMRSYNGRVFRLEQHLKRLETSAQQLGIPMPGLDLASACYRLLEENSLTEARLRLTLTAGTGEAVPDTDTCKSSTAVIMVRPLAPLPREKYQQGFHAVLSSLQRNSRSLLSRIKSTSYAESVFARREARLMGVDEVVMLNEKGMVAEGSTCNIFIVSKGLLVTPSPDSGALPGITRAVVLELARAAGLKIEEREFTPGELAEADEAFVTSSIIEVMPLTYFDGKPVGQGSPGAITVGLLDAYRGLVRDETGFTLS